MRANTFLRLAIGSYILFFFAYLFGPLILMSVTAFNSSAFPRVSPWQCFTFEWFGELVQDAPLMEGFWNSLFIGIGVVAVSVPLGLAGAIMLTQLRRTLRSVYYTIVISPILVPGVVLGISTLIFWDRLGTMLDAEYDSFFYNGMFLTVIGQSTFISAYCMLVFIARLQRFDPALEEAALDLGATHVQAFRKILIPFLRPAIGSAAVLAFLASFENYNTTVFTIVSDSTLTTVLASKVRYGINPAISSLAVIIVVVTLVGAIVYEFMRRREAAAAAAIEAEGGAVAGRVKVAKSLGEPLMVLLTLVFIAGLGTAWMAATYDTGACKTELAKERELRRQIREAPGMFIPRIQKPVTESDVQAPGTEQYRGTFDPKNLQQLGPGEKEAAPAGEAPAESPGAKQYKGIFDPGNLQDLAPGEEGKGETKSPGAEQYKSIFDPSNLQQLGPGQEGKDQGPAKSPGAEQYKSIFDPKNLQQLGPEGDKKQDGATQ
jgi:spermidine/putrescine transport system permease protein